MSGAAKSCRAKLGPKNCQNKDFSASEWLYIAVEKLIVRLASGRDGEGCAGGGSKNVHTPGASSANKVPLVIGYKEHVFSFPQS